MQSTSHKSNMANQGPSRQPRQQGRQQGQPSGSRNRPNLYLHFPRPYEQSYNEREGVGERAAQSGFVSSTTYTAFDLKWYKMQTVYAPSRNATLKPVQDSQITNSDDVKFAHFLRELREDP